MKLGELFGIVTYSTGELTPELLAAAGVPPYAPIEGVDPAGTFGRTIRHGAAELDVAAMAADVVAAARRLVGAHRDVGAIVLECANMPPCSGLPGHKLPLGCAGRMNNRHFMGRSHRVSYNRCLTLSLYEFTGPATTPASTSLSVASDTGSIAI